MLHWGWEAEAGWRELERLAGLIAPYTAAWEDFLDVVARSRRAHDAPPASGAERVTALTCEQLRERFPRVAVVHEWLTNPGGSEHVVLELLEMFPRGGAVHLDLRPRPVARVDHRAPGPHLLT